MTKEDQLNKLREKALTDKSLPKFEGATNLVFGHGGIDRRIIFLGEGPGYWEDLKGIPFVGRAGALLNQVLGMVKLPREEVFVTNVVMYRPPNNRDPEAHEMKAFEKYVDEIIAIIEPKVVVTLGRFSMGKFLPGVMISSVHGRVYKVQWKDRTITVVPMYHPAAALRNSDILRKFKEDFQKLPAIIKDAAKVEAKQMELV